MPGENSVDEVDDAVDGEQPHAGKMPLQGAGKPILVVKVHRAVVTAPQRELDRKIKRKNRIGIVDAPSAHDHDEHCERIEPMRDPHGQGIHDDLRNSLQTPGRDVSHHRLLALVHRRSAQAPRI